MSLDDYKDVNEYPFKALHASKLPIALDTETIGITRGMNIPFYFSYAAADVPAGGGPVMTPNGNKFLTELVNCGRPIVMHNAKFDITALERIGLFVDTNNFHDTTLMHALLDEHDVHQHALKILSKRYLGHDRSEAPEIQAMFKNAKIPNTDIPQVKLHGYAVDDAIDTWQLYELFKEMMFREDTQLWDVYQDIELRATVVYKEMDQTGVHCDIKNVCKTLVMAEEMVAKLLTELHDVFKEPFNPRSPQQLSKLLSKHFKLTQRTKTGYCTDKTVLEKFNYDTRIKTLLAYKAFEKSRQTLAGYKRLEVEGKLHSDYRQTTTTGRAASQKPNLMNIPKQRGRISELEIGSKELADKCSQAFQQVRATFIAPKGGLLFAPDYKQAEYRAFAYYSGSQRLRDALAAGEDFHDMVCRLIFGGYTKRQRHIIKIVNYGLIYGMGEPLLLQHIRKDCDDPPGVLKDYEKMLPEMRITQASVKQMAQRRGYVTDVFGRHYRYVRNRPHAVVSWLCQGTVANIKKIALWRVREVLRQWRETECPSSLAQIVMDIHDQLVIEVYPQDVPIMERIKTVMEDFPQFGGIPMTTDCSIGPNLLDQRDMSLEEACALLKNYTS